MRISTNMIYDSAADRLSDQQSVLLKTQQQISANRRILTPADDPIAAARALDVTQGQSVNAQFKANRGNAKDSLSQEENVLDSVTTLIQDIQTQVVEAGNASLDDEQRKYIATDLRSRLQELVGLANSRDGEGNYIFAGFKTTTQPFASSTSGSVSYHGDQGQRMLQVDAARDLAISDTGDAIFNNIPGYDTFNVTSTGGLTVNGFSVSDSTGLAAKPDTYNYDVTFDAAATPPTYTVKTTSTPPATVATGNYVSGEAIKFNGLQVVVSGTPASTDTLAIRPTATGKQTVFDTVNDLISALETPASGIGGKANLTHSLEIANGNLSNALDQVLTVRASVGSRLKEIDALDSTGDDKDLQYSERLSDLQDLDYIKAVSDLSKQQYALEAAQKSFMAVSGLSLFKYL